MMQTLYIAIGLAAAATAAPLLYLRLFRVNIPRMSRRFYTDSTELYAQRFPLILRAFLTGNNGAVSPFCRMNDLRQKLERQIAPFYKGFAYEGTGMGFGARASLLPKPGQAFEKWISELDERHIYQYYVGLGWFLRIRYGFRTRAYRKWMASLNPQYALIVFDGVGFKTALFQYATTKRIWESFASFPPNHQRVCYQGMGRAIWFIKRFDLAQAMDEIGKWPSDFRCDAYSGLGLAVAYSFFDKLSYAGQAEREIPALYRAAFRQGMAFGWEARKLQNDSFWQEQLAKFTDSVTDRTEMYVSLVHKARQKLDNAGNANEGYYTRWMDETRLLMERVD